MAPMMAVPNPARAMTCRCDLASFQRPELVKWRNMSMGLQSQFLEHFQERREPVFRPKMQPIEEAGHGQFRETERAPERGQLSKMRYARRCQAKPDSDNCR